MIEPTAPAPRRSSTSIALAGLVAFGLFSGAIALTGRGRQAPPPLPLLADTSGRRGEAAALSVAPTPAAGGLDIRVEGTLPDLGERAQAWDVVTPDLDAAGAARMARAVGLPGEPAGREGGWALDTGDGSFTAWPGESGWSIAFFRSAGSSAGAQPADGEGVARQLLENMGVLDGDWRIQTQATQIGTGVACAEAVMGKALAPDRPVPSSPSCPPPPPPMAGVSVSFTPVLDGRRVDGSGWSVVIGPGDAVQSVSGTWARFERRGDYDLRPVSAALEELRSGSGGGPRPLPPEAEDETAPAVTLTCPRARVPEDGETFPVPAGCGAPDPVAVVVTGVELGLLPAPGWDGQRSRLYLVPAYRFVGHFEDGSDYEASVVAMAPGAIAPPPTLPGKPVPLPAPAPPPAG